MNAAHVSQARVMNKSNFKSELRALYIRESQVNKALRQICMNIKKEVNVTSIIITHYFLYFVLSYIANTYFYQIGFRY